jgi:hypothetical protein
MCRSEREAVQRSAASHDGLRASQVGHGLVNRRPHRLRTWCAGSVIALLRQLSAAGRCAGCCLPLARKTSYSASLTKPYYQTSQTSETRPSTRWHAERYIYEYIKRPRSSGRQGRRQGRRRPARAAACARPVDTTS